MRCSNDKMYGERSGLIDHLNGVRSEDRNGQGYEGVVHRGNSAVVLMEVPSTGGRQSTWTTATRKMRANKSDFCPEGLVFGPPIQTFWTYIRDTRYNRALCVEFKLTPAVRRTHGRMKPNCFGKKTGGAHKQKETRRVSMLFKKHHSEKSIKL